MVGLVLSISASAQCTDLFFSEYIEGSSSNKALEVYNPTNAAVSLDDYVIYRCNNGSVTATDSLFPQGTLASNDVFVISNSSAAKAGITSNSDTTHTMTFYNGDDAVILINKATGDTLDIIGVIGVDPGSGWTVGSGATNNFTLVRNYNVKNGTKDWSTASSNWDVYAIDEDSYIGAHSSSCHPPAAPEVEFSNGSYFVDENAGTASVEVTIASPSATDTTKVEVSVTGGTAVDGTDYSITSSTMLVFNPGDAASQMVTMSITDNAVAAANTTIELALINLSSNAEFGNDSTSMVTIINDDYQVSTIADAVMLDADLAPTNEDMKYELTGIVYGIDMDGNNGLSFTIIDSTDGINIFNFNDVSDYVVTEGDEITARGRIDFYNGLLELFVDSIKVNSQGNSLKDPIQIHVPGEIHESDFVQLNKVWIADTTTVWPNNGNVLVTNKFQDTFQVRIDRDTDIEGMPVAYDTMTIVGIGGQFDFSAPYDEGYQVFPRSIADIIEYVNNPASTKALSLEVSVYPNPASSSITVVSSVKWSKYAIYNTIGVKVQEGEMLNNSLNVGELTNGNYILRLGSANAAGISQFIINK